MIEPSLLIGVLMAVSFGAVFALLGVASIIKLAQVGAPSASRSSPRGDRYE